MYDVIVLGATFAAAGIAERYGKRCLVIEARAQAGYEFFGALHFDTDEASVYPYFEKCKTLFGTSTASIERKNGAFYCLCHGGNGFCTYAAKRVIDTRCTEKASLSKTYNLLIQSDKEPDFQGVKWKKAKGGDRYLLFCPVPPSASFPEARSIALSVIRSFSNHQKLILSANEFDYRSIEKYRKDEKGIVYVPSKAYGTPDAAFAAGMNLKEELQ